MGRRNVLAGALLTALPKIVWAQGLPQPTLLTLALDGSGSMHNYRSLIEDELVKHFQIQRDGHVLALKDPQIKAALVRSEVVCQVVLWSDVGKHEVLIGPTSFQHTDDVEVFADALFDAVPTVHQYLETNHASAIEFCLSKGIAGYKHVIDFCSDEAPPGRDSMVELFHHIASPLDKCKSARDLAHRLGVQINVIAINLGPRRIISNALEKSLQTPDGFTVPVLGWGSFYDAVKRKIIKELNLA